MTIKMEIKDLDIYGDSQLVIKQLLKEYEVKKDDLVSWHKYALRLDLSVWAGQVQYGLCVFEFG